MASATLLQTAATYTDDNHYNVINTIATKNVVAMVDDETNQAQSLFLGASKDVTIQATEGLVMNLGSSNALVINDDSNVPSLKMVTNATTTTITSVDKNLALTTADNSNLSITLGAMEISQSNNYQKISTAMPLGFQLDHTLKVTDNALIEKSVSIGGNIVCNESIFTKNYNLIRYNPTPLQPTDPTITGYAFTVNTQNQLELLKHTTFSNGVTVTKRVGVFGLNNLSDTDTSDSLYTGFNSVIDAANYTNPQPLTSPVNFTSPPPILLGIGGVAATSTGRFLGPLSMTIQNEVATTYPYPPANQEDLSGNLDDSHIDMSSYLQFDFFFMGTNYTDSPTQRKLWWHTNNVMMFLDNPLSPSTFSWGLQPNYGKMIALGMYDRRGGHFSISNTMNHNGMQYVTFLWEASNDFSDDVTRTNLTALQWQITMARASDGIQYIEVRSAKNPTATGEWNISTGSELLNTFSSPFNPATFVSFVLRSDPAGITWELLDNQHLNLPTAPTYTFP